MPAVPTAAGPLLVIGGFPPVPGAVTAATLTLVRDEVRSGAHVVTAAVRPGGAERVLVRASGFLAGWRLEQARRATGAERLVIALDDGVPARTAQGGKAAVTAWCAAASLALGMRRFASVTLLVATDPGVPAAALRPLWSAAGTVVGVGGAGLATALGAPAAKVTGTALPPPLRGMVGAGVSALGPAEVSPLAMPRYVAGRIGRRVLGRRFMRVYTTILRTQNLARRIVGRVRRMARSAPGR